MFNNRRQQQQNSDDVGRISLWENFDPQKKHVLSGIVDIEGQEFVVYVYENNQPKDDRSPQFFGYIKEKRQQQQRSRFPGKQKQQQRPPQQQYEYDELEDRRSYRGKSPHDDANTFTESVGQDYNDF